MEIISLTCSVEAVYAVRIGFTLGFFLHKFEEGADENLENSLIRLFRSFSFFRVLIFLITRVLGVYL